MIRAFKGVGRILLLCHKNADPDAVCSAVALGKFASLFLKKEVTYSAPGGISSLSKQVLELINSHITFIENPSLSDFDLLVLIDTGSLEQVSPYGNEVMAKGKKVVVIDHHSVNELLKRLANFYIVDPAATSTAELVYKLLRKTKALSNKLICQALLTGIMYDSRRFAIVSKDTLIIAADLVRRGASYEKALSSLRAEIQYSERVARLKACQRMKLYGVKGEWIIAFSHVGSYEAAVARSLVELGADMAFVFNEGEDKARLSIRLSEKMRDAFNLNLGDELIPYLASNLSGEGGGHSLAAGFAGKFSLTEFESLALSWLKQRLSPEVKLIT